MNQTQQAIQHDYIAGSHFFLKKFSYEQNDKIKVDKSTSNKEKTPETRRTTLQTLN